MHLHTYTHIEIDNIIYYVDKNISMCVLRVCVCDVERILNDFPQFWEHVGHASATHIETDDDE